MRDGKRNAAAFACVVSAFDANRDEFGRTLAVANDRLRKLDRYTFDRAVDDCRSCIRRRRYRFDRRLARRRDDKAVVGRRVAVDGRAIERNIGDTARHRGQQLGGDRRIGRHERQHRRHVGMNHPGSFGNAGHRDGNAVDRRDRAAYW